MKRADLSANDVAVRIGHARQLARQICVVCRADA